MKIVHVIGNASETKIMSALKSKGICQICIVITVGGPGNYIVIYDTIGDTRVACLDLDYDILWDKPA